MKRTVIVWVMVLLALGVSIFTEPLVNRPLESSLSPVDEVGIDQLNALPALLPGVNA
ncbi:MAG: hypothetical protein WCL02_09070 [bacterium]